MRVVAADERRAAAVAADPAARQPVVDVDANSRKLHAYYTDRGYDRIARSPRYDVYRRAPG